MTQIQAFVNCAEQKHVLNKVDGKSARVYVCVTLYGRRYISIGTTSTISLFLLYSKDRAKPQQFGMS